VHHNKIRRPTAEMGHNRPFALVEQHASFTPTSRHSARQSSRRPLASCGHQLPSDFWKNRIWTSSALGGIRRRRVSRGVRAALRCAEPDQVSRPAHRRRAHGRVSEIPRRGHRTDRAVPRRSGLGVVHRRRPFRGGHDGNIARPDSLAAHDPLQGYPHRSGSP
jgi:hypothetical protein